MLGSKHGSMKVLCLVFGPIRSSFDLRVSSPELALPKAKLLLVEGTERLDAVYLEGDLILPGVTCPCCLLEPRDSSMEAVPGPPLIVVLLSYRILVTGTGV